MPDRIYIFELKLKAPAKKALKQIQEKEYYQRFSKDQKPLILVGLSFNRSQKKLTVTCAVQELPA